MTVAARLEVPSTEERRVSRRRKVHLGSKSTRGRDEVVIYDISPTGMLLSSSKLLHSFEEIELDLPETGSTKATVVWNSGKFYGCQFNQPLPKAAVSAALLRSPVPPNNQVHESTDEAAEEPLDGEELGFGTKLRVILATSFFLWMVIFVGASAMWRSV